MDREKQLKRLYFRSTHRGTKEADVLLGPYAATHLPAMDGPALSEFEAFLEENDNDIWDWIAGVSKPPGGRYRELLQKLRERHDHA